jgi:recombination protein RecA
MVKTQDPCLYIVDSLDALSDRAEKDREIDKGTFGANKPKIIGQLFRRCVKDMERSRIHLMIISQIRDNIGVSFGETKSRTGGRAMDFYASQILWLAQLKRLDRTIRKQKRVYGIQVKAQCKKNKIGLPFREAEFPILFGYGMDEAEALLTWLESIDFDISIWNEYKDGKSTLAQSIKMLDSETNKKVMQQIREVVAKNWEEIETRFLPTVRKY